MSITIPVERFLVHIRPGPDGAKEAASSSSLYVDLRGTIELLQDAEYLTIGQFETAIFLLPDLASVADGIARLREGAQKVEISLLESPPLRFVRPRREPQLVEVRYIASVIKDIRVDELDRAFGGALCEFFSWLTSQRRRTSIDADSMQYVEVIASVWPEIAPLLQRVK